MHPLAPSNRTRPIVDQPLAIVGMDCRLPGADGLEAYWKLIEMGGYSIARLPEAKLDRSRFFQSRKGIRGKTYAEVGGCVAPRNIDWSLLNVPRDEAGDWDECHLNLCEIAARACRDAGYDPRNMPVRNSGVFIGHSGGSTLGGELAYRACCDEYVKLAGELLQGEGHCATSIALDCEQRLLHLLTESRPVRRAGKPRVDASCAATLVGRNLNCSGPQLSIDAACASSLVALALGCLSLQRGDIDVAIVGGASFNKADSLILFSHAQSCSATGSRPFDQCADGLISSEGYVCLVLKTLDRALADADRIHAVVQGIGMSSDGRGRSLWAPRSEGQSAAIARAYSDKVRPDSIQMIEAHATSTPLGDATEMSALADFYSKHLPAKHRLPVTSVKSNIGHTLETAGLAGVVKAILSMQNGVVPASINFEKPNEAIAWDAIPLYVANKNERWPNLPDGQPKRAAVNAFGIGGLNVHVVLEQPLTQSERQSFGLEMKPRTTQLNSLNAKQVSGFSTRSLEPIAIIGRGVVLLGARNIEEFRRLLSTKETVVDLSQPIRRIPNFQYDWRRHKIPPKQLANANPLQFMLLDAAEQALREAHMFDGDFDREHTAVIVGSAFGGDFGNELFAGLRLPEFRERLLQVLLEQNIAPDKAEELAGRYEHLFLERFPALLDETGSFTSSTLASRLSKTFDLMGGAMAMDSGDASSFQALDAACQLLHSGAVSHVLCAGAQRATDLAAQENLTQLGLLGGVGMQNGYAIGEGVALVVLKRHCDAIRDGNAILSVIDGIGAGFDPFSLSKSLSSAVERFKSFGGTFSSPLLPNGKGPQIESVTERFSKQVATDATVIGALGIESLDQAVQVGLSNAEQTRLAPQIDSRPVRLVKSAAVAKICYLQASQGLVDVIAASFSSTPRQSIASHSRGGQSFVVTVSLTSPAKQQAAGGLLRSNVSEPEPSKANGASSVFRFIASNLPELQQSVLSAGRQSADARTSFSDKKQFAASNSAWRAAVVCSAADLPSRTEKLSALIGQPATRNLAIDQGLLWRSPASSKSCPLISDEASNKKVAWVFPGQGSQYLGMLKPLVMSHRVASEAMREADQLLNRYDGVSFADLAWNKSSELGSDIWYTQASMLIADWILLQTLRGLGLSPDFICGHSYGEIPAMLAAGCWDLETALQVTWHRCRSVTTHALADFALLSILADESTVARALAKAGRSLVISHRNAPCQTVVAGLRSDLRDFALQLEQEGVANKILSVPTAFHTPALNQAVQPFASALAHIPILPPRVPLLSNVTNKFVGDPEDIRNGLAQQLVIPQDFVALVHKLVQVGTGYVIEVGPQQVLTKLIRQCEPSLLCLPLDGHRNGSSSVETHSDLGQDLIRVAAELFGWQQVSQDVAPLVSVSNRPVAKPIAAIEHFDATTARRSRLRKQGRTSDAAIRHRSGAPPAAAHFDATQGRRANHLRSAGIMRTAAEATTHVANTLESSRTNELNNRLNQRSAVGEQAALEAFLIDFVVEQTGYPPEMIGMDWDLESDLGIDSIKKAQLIGELRDYFGIEQNGDVKFSNYRTLRDIANTLQNKIQAGDFEETTTAANSQPKTSESYQPVLLPSTTVQPPNAASPAIDRLTDFLIEFVVEQTGYPKEIVELDADLEADLGIDSIKKTQLVGELRELLTSDSRADQFSNWDRNALSELRTLRALREALGELFDGKETRSRNEVVTKPVQVSSSLQATTDESSQRSYELIENELQRANSPTAFVEAVRHNLLSMVSRPHDDESVWDAFDESVIIRSDRDHLASISNMLPSSLVAFECLLSSKLSCSLVGDLKGRSSKAVEGGESSSDNEDLHRSELPESKVRWLASWRLPSWLVTCRQPLAVAESFPAEGAEASQSIVIAGSLLPLAIRRGRFLMVAGMDDQRNDRAAQAFNLARSLESLHFDTLQSAVEGITAWAIADRFSVVVADLRDDSLLKLEACSGVLEQRLLPINAVENGFAEGWDESEIRIGVDQGRVVIGQYQRFDKEPEIAVLKSNRSMCRAALAQDGELEPSVAPGTDLSIDHFTCSEEREQSSAPITRDVANRYVLRMVPARQRQARGRQPSWSGAALVVGDNPVARQLEARLLGAGVAAVRLSGSQENEFELAERFIAMAAQQPIPHLFLLTPCDRDAFCTLDEAKWLVRRRQGLMSVFWLCQKWIEHVTSSGLGDDASLFVVSTLGGDFGFGGNLHSAEGGGLNGLLKSMLIESWMRGHRTLPIKTLDVSASQSPAEIVDCLWRELTVPSYDNEIGYINGERHVVRALPRPLVYSTDCQAEITRGGTWLCTGGARGITAIVGERLAERFGLSLHLLGTSDLAGLDPDWSNYDEEQLRVLKLQTMSAAREQNQNAIKAWQQVEKLLEIDRNLKRLARLGIKAYYHCCDVSDRSAVHRVVLAAREQSGPIRGVLHGAGVGQDARFDRKQRDKVDQCIAAKVDGAWALMHATQSDPIEAFIGFGSISGRFGANGHSDYSLANEMLCKQLNWLRRIRPEVRAIGFHWHAWGDVGMATKPETRLALETIGMQFMPAEEGVRHLIAELESGAGESEVLITDDRYYRMFYPAETLTEKGTNNAANDLAAEIRTPLLVEASEKRSESRRHFVAEVDPVRDPFLADHLLDKRPLMPFVVACEMLLEAGKKHLNSNSVVLRDAVARSGLRFFHDSPQSLLVESERICASAEPSDEQLTSDSSMQSIQSTSCTLQSYFVARDGRQMDSSRVNFAAKVVQVDSERNGREQGGRVQVHLSPDAVWSRAVYPEVDAEFYVGWPFQRLKTVSLVPNGIVGQISAPALIELAGGHRDVRGWSIPSAAMDACLFAVGVLAWNQVAAGTALPVRMSELRIGRLPSPGEACEVHAVLKGHDRGSAKFDFSLFGIDGDMILDASGYEVAWLAGEFAASKDQRIDAWKASERQRSVRESHD